MSASCPPAGGPAILTRVRRTGIQFYHLDNLFIPMEAEGLQWGGVSGSPAFRFGFHAAKAADPLLWAQTPPRVSAARRRGTRAPPPREEIGVSNSPERESDSRLANQKKG